MTLDTRIVIKTPTDARAVFDFCRTLVGADDTHTYERVNTDTWPNPGWSNDLAQGLPAWLWVWYGPDGPLQEEKYAEDEITPAGVGPHDPAGFIKVSFDTAYSYRDTNGAGCGDLHARLVRELGAWLDSQDLPWIWQNEFTGEWHTGYDGLDELGDGGRAAMDWFTGTVLPAIAAHAATEG